MTDDRRGSMTSNQELWELVQARCNNTLTETQWQRLNELLLADREARLFYAAHVQLDARLRWATRGCDEPELADAVTPARVLGQWLPEAVSPWRHPSRFIGTCVVLTLVFWVAVVAVVWPRLRGIDVAGQAVLREEAPDGPIVARLIRMVDARWGGDPQRAPLPGTHLRQGRRLELKSGQVQLTSTKGATVIIEGPAEFTATDVNALHLELGQLIAHVPDDAVGFVVETPRANITDLGTEFGTRVTENGMVEVEVFQGRVELRHVSGESQPLQAGSAVRLAGSGVQTIAAVELSDQLRKQMNRWRQYAQRMHVQSDGHDFVGFEAEHYKSLVGKGWIVVDTTPTKYSPRYDRNGDGVDNEGGVPVLPADTNASGRKALLADFTNEVGTATYQVTFKTAGDYFLYFHKSAFEGGQNDNGEISFGNEDSFYLSPRFGVAPRTEEEAEDVVDFDMAGAMPGDGQWEGRFGWERAQIRSTKEINKLLVYRVEAGDLDRPLVLQIRSREGGAALDYFLFSTNPNLTGRQLDRMVAERLQDVLFKPADEESADENSAKDKTD